MHGNLFKETRAGPTRARIRRWPNCFKPGERDRLIFGLFEPLRIMHQIGPEVIHLLLKSSRSRQRSKQTENPANRRTPEASRRVCRRAELRKHAVPLETAGVQVRPPPTPGGSCSPLVPAQVLRRRGLWPPAKEETSGFGKTRSGGEFGAGMRSTLRKGLLV